MTRHGTEAMPPVVSAGKHPAARLVVIALVMLAALPVLPWWAVALWAAAASGSAMVAEYSLATGRTRHMVITVTAIVSTALFAVMSGALMWWGDPTARLFGCAMMAVSMVYVLMSYYNSRPILLGAAACHLSVFLSIALGLTRSQLAEGHFLAAFTPAATLAMFAILIGSARAQLLTNWIALHKAQLEAQERARTADAANEAKTAFLATMSHEIRTPLNGVLGMAQAMAADKLSDIQANRLKVIHSAGENLLVILNDLLDLSKIEADKLELEISEFDLPDLAKGVVAIFAPLAAGKDVSLRLAITANAKGSFQGDPTRLRQIVYNLLSNAVKFTQAGDIKVSIRRVGGNLVICVADSGVGIPAENLPRLFESFYQGDTSTTRLYGGTGLGLSICRKLATLMGGDIEVQSTPGQGSVFVVRVPLKRVRKAASPAGQADAPVQPAEQRQLSILAAEDNEINQLVLKTLLQQAGIDPVLVADGAAAVEAWERQDWDLILMDVQMPVMDGPEATRAIRLREAETGRRRTPILALTANAMSHQLADYQAAGMDGLIAKPIEVSQLFASIEDALALAADVAKVRRKAG